MDFLKKEISQRRKMNKTDFKKWVKKRMIIMRKETYIRIEPILKQAEQDLLEMYPKYFKEKTKWKQLKKKI